LSQAATLAARFNTLALASPGYQALVSRATHSLASARKIEGIAQIAAQVSLRGRPGAGALLGAGRSRRVLYRKAADAYRTLLLIEAGDNSAIAALLQDTLLGPLEPWRRFELATGLAVGTALADATQMPLRVN